MKSYPILKFTGGSSPSFFAAGIQTGDELITGLNNRTVHDIDLGVTFAQTGLYLTDGISFSKPLTKGTSTFPIHRVINGKITLNGNGDLKIGIYLPSRPSQALKLVSKSKESYRILLFSN